MKKYVLIVIMNLQPLHGSKNRKKKMAKIVICPNCKREIEVRSGFAHHTLNNHIQKEHK
jgi:hypothetical protein